MALVEFRLLACEGAKLGRADRREVFRMREEDQPMIADVIV
jgi:hypothetical protein